MDVHKLCDAIKPIVDKYKDEENIEMEFRLGRFNGTFFDTNIGDKTYADFIRGFSSYTGWETIEENTYDVYSREDNNIRLTVDNKTGEDTLIKKDHFDVVIQINGKKRAIINAINNENEENVFSKSLAIKNIKVILEEKTITKKIFIKNKLLNIVTND